ncbi:MAG: hypothetical protein JSU93_03500 [Methanobacteriota archaeon]|nr:MAG: hypothetical protein JSU93_03500 [Euryarchaeota archaeon]
MIRATMNLKIIVVIVSAALLLAFSRLSLSLLVPEVIGLALILFGIVISYRPAAVLGLFITLSVAALSAEITTLADIDIWQTSILGLLVPTSLLAWAALLSEQSESYDIRLWSRPLALALFIGAAIAVAVPLAVVVIALVSPSSADSLSTMAEISLLFVVISVVALVLTLPDDAKSSDGVGESP